MLRLARMHKDYLRFWWYDESWHFIAISLITSICRSLFLLRLSWYYQRFLNFRIPLTRKPRLSNKHDNGLSIFFTPISCDSSRNPSSFVQLTMSFYVVQEHTSDKTFLGQVFYDPMKIVHSHGIYGRIILPQSTSEKRNEARVPNQTLMKDDFQNHYQ